MNVIKKYGQVILLYAVLLVLFIVGTFYDLNISLNLADPVNSTVARFLEIWAEPPSLLFVAFVFCMLSVCMYRESGKKNKYLAFVCMLAGAVTAYITSFRTAEYYSEEIVGEIWFLAVLAGISILIASLFVFLASRIGQASLLKMKKAMITVVVAGLLTLVVISVLKSLWGRIRFREMWAIGEKFELFMPWYKPGGRAVSDGYKSFPSGHTSNAALLFMVYYLFAALDKKKIKTGVKIAAVAWIAVVMLSRILCGAHFLTDVCAGAMITAGIILMCKKIFKVQA